MKLLLGDCIDVLRSMDESSIDAVVTDPPYGLGFMGKDWDHFDSRNFSPDELKKRGATEGGYDHTRGRLRSGSMHAGEYDFSRNQEFQRWCFEWAQEVLRVLKPGGHLLAFGGARTYHRLACAIEDAGFDIRDSIVWIFGSGFPKSLDVSKAIDKMHGADREVVGKLDVGPDMRGGNYANADGRMVAEVTVPATDDAKTWAGWGTALKPAHEPIIVARKPLVGTVVANVLEHGTGALNIDGCRIAGGEGGDRNGESSADSRYADRGATPFAMTPGPRGGDARGRWPSNVILDEAAAEELDRQSGTLVSGANPTRRGTDKFREVYGDFAGQEEAIVHRGRDEGGASRFFYVAKPSRLERNVGVLGEAREIIWSSGTQSPGTFQSPNTERAQRNFHPTVKPIALMRHLIRLVTPMGGGLVDPFMGSGTTGIAAHLEGVEFIGIERDPDYLSIAEQRIAYFSQFPPGANLERVLERGRPMKAVELPGQQSFIEDAS